MEVEVHLEECSHLLVHHFFPHFTLIFGQQVEYGPMWDVLHLSCVEEHQVPATTRGEIPIKAVENYIQSHDLQK